MPLIALGEWLQSRLRVLVLAVLAAGIIHILVTFSADRFAAATPFTRLTPIVPLHAFAVLPPVGPKTQPLAYLSPDFRYAMCRYDTSAGPVSVSARLPGRGWALALYSRQGDNFYTAMGIDGQPTDVALELTPTADRFLGLTPEAQGKIGEAAAALSIATGAGVAIVRAPDQGVAYRYEAEAILKMAKCTPHPF